MRTLALVVSLALPASAQAPRIGAAGAVSGGVTASGPTKRALKSGSEVFHKDEVSTDAKGRLQVLLLDETVFTVGPESRVVLDEFVYDPFSGAGKVTAQVTKGVFRFVTGKVAGNRAQDMKIKIPSGTIGIRGTFGAGSVDGNGDALVALLGPGPDNNGNERVGGIDVETGKGKQSLDEPGTGVIVKADGEVSGPFILTPEQTEQLNAGGSGGGSGQSASSSGSAGDDGGESGTEGAGQDTALAGADADDSSDLGDGTAGLGEETNTASQEASESAAILDGLATWDNVRTLETGQYHFYGTGGAFNFTSCSPGPCANSNAGTMWFAFDIDFGARTVGGGNSYISASDSDTGVTANSGFASVSGSLPQQSFSSLAGDAVLSGTLGSGTSYSISIQNSGGNAATSAVATATYSVGSDLATGSVNGPRFNGLSPAQ